MTDRRRGAHLRPVLTPSRFAAVWWATCVPAAVLLGFALDRLDGADLVDMGPAFWCIAGLVVLGELRPVVASRFADPDGVSLGTAFLFATLLHWGLAATLALVLVGTVIGELARRKRLFALLFNVSQYTVSYAAAGAVLHLAGRQPTPTEPAALVPVDLFLVLAAALTYHLVNYLVVSTAIAYVEDRPVVRVLSRGALYYFVTTLAVLALAPLIVVVVMVHWGFLPLMLLPLGLVYRTAQMSRDREHDAMHDALTGVGNRALLMRRAQEVLEHDRRSSRTGLLSVLDLNGFKAINDRYGHAAGDQLLVLVARRLAAAVRDDDLVARLGGDEFAVLMPEVDVDEHEEITARLEQVFRDPFEVHGEKVVLRAAIGSVTFPDESDHDLDGLLRLADAAMYRRKPRDLVDLERAAPTSLELWAEAVRASGPSSKQR